MRRRLGWIVLVFVLAIFLTAPVFEHFDHWDNFPQSGQDIVLTVIGMLVCFAAVVSLIRELVQVAAKQVNLPRSRAPERGIPAHEDFFDSVSSGSQPLPLRI